MLHKNTVDIDSYLSISVYTVALIDRKKNLLRASDNNPRDSNAETFYVLRQ